MGLDLDVSTPEGAFAIASLVLLLALIAVRLSRRLKGGPPRRAAAQVLAAPDAGR